MRALTALMVALVTACAADDVREDPNPDATSSPDAGADASPDAAACASEVLEGVLRTSRDRARLQCARVVIGDVMVDSSGAIALPALQLVTGSLTFEGRGARLDVPRLARVGGHVFVHSNVRGTEIAAPALVEVEGWLSLYGAGITGIDLPALTTVGGYLQVALTSLTDVPLPSLRSAGELTISGNPDLTSVAGLSRLRVVHRELRLRENASLRRAELPELTDIDGDLILEDRALEHVALPSLMRVRGSIRSLSLAALDELSMPQLASVGGDLVIRDSAALRRLSLPNLVTVDGDDRDSEVLRSIELWASGLETVELPQLARAPGSIVIGRQPRLKELLLPALTEAGRIVIAENATLSSLEAPVLARAELLLVARCPLAWLATGALVELRDGLDLRETQLTSLTGLRALRYAARATFEDNPALPAAEVSALRARLGL